MLCNRNSLFIVHCTRIDLGIHQCSCLRIHGCYHGNWLQGPFKSWHHRCAKHQSFINRYTCSAAVIVKRFYKLNNCQYQTQNCKLRQYSEFCCGLAQIYFIKCSRIKMTAVLKIQSCRYYIQTL